ncbi:putative serine/threonine-protein kinase C05D10.2 [Clonorchis sinensis]|uniref:Putative serine/threonine-protein kinase C05D10.2 n=1 Tax=Clonorchis sinensis TaxID=79923 RepID=G7YV07_CLOSI|nr:putative serine/threonine-protein kinase C05D10.2 [Clonorchis sinensis]
MPEKKRTQQLYSEQASVKAPRQPLEQMFSNADKNALDLMFRMLRLNPLRRITALEALQHPYLRRFYRPSEILTMSHHVVPPLDDNVQLSIAEYRNLLYKMIISNKLRVRRQNRNTQISNATHTVKVDREEQSSGVPRSPKEKDQKSSPLKTIPNSRMGQQETVLVTRKSSGVENTANLLESTEPEMSGDMDKCTSRTLRGSTNGLHGIDENQTTSTDIDSTPRTRTESVKRSQLETKHDLPGTVQKPEVKPYTHSSAAARHSDVVTRRRGIQVKPSLQSSYSVIQNKLATGQCGPAASNNPVGERDIDHRRQVSGTYQSDAFLRRCPSASILSNPNKNTQDSLRPLPSSPLPDRIYAAHRPKSSTHFERVSYDFRPHSRIHGTRARSRLDNHSDALVSNKRLISQEIVLGGHVPTNAKPPPALQHQNGVSGSKHSGSLIESRSFVGGDTLVHEQLYKDTQMNPVETLVYNGLLQLDVLYKAAPSFSWYDVRYFAMHCCVDVTHYS